MTQRRAQLAIVFLVAVTLAAALWLVLMIRSNTAPLPAPTPQPTAKASPSADPLAWYKSLPTACPPSIDPELREKFYRQGQCPTSK